MKQNIIAYIKIHMREEICLSTQEEKVKKPQNYCCFRLAGLTCEHVGHVCRCIYIQRIHSQIWPWLGQHVRGASVVAGWLSMMCLCHMSTAFLGTKTRPLCEAFECCQGKPIRGSVGLACHNMLHAFFFFEEK